MFGLLGSTKLGYGKVMWERLGERSLQARQRLNYEFTSKDYSVAYFKFALFSCCERLLCNVPACQSPGIKQVR